VDDTAPNPPDYLTIAAAEMQRFDANPASGDPEHWVISLSGKVKDPILQDGTAGSGIPSDGVTVTLRSPDGGVLGDGAQTALISGDAWSVQYDFTEPQPSGCYDVQAGAVDNILRMYDLDPDQRAPHRDREPAHQPGRRSPGRPARLGQSRWRRNRGDAQDAGR
jgi:hypothetical protein